MQRRRARAPAPVAHQPMPTQQSPAFTKIEECSHYDVPRAPMPVQRIGMYDCPRPLVDWYDAPRAPRPASADSACSGTGSLASATSSASANSGSSVHSAASASSTYDVPRSRALPLPCDAALEALDRLQEEASAAVSRLLSYVSPGWRRRGALRARVLDVRVAGARLRAALHDLAVFADATLANAHDAQDKGIAVKLRPLVKALKDAERITHEATSALDAGDWAPERLERDREPTDGTEDALDQLVSCARSLTEDVRRAASFINGNASLLFRRSPAVPVPEHEWTEEYDYVRLESRTAVGRRNAEIRAALPDKLRASFDALVRDADHAGEVSAVAAATRLPADDRQLAAFYAAQAATYGAHLATAVEAFLRTIEMGQPPDVFLAHGKFVVLSAHRIVHVGDTVHRSARHSGLKTQALRCSDALSDALAATVAKTKAAAQQFPCAGAVSAVAAATRLPADDRQLAAFYAAQAATYGAHLATAVEAFLRTIEMGQPPDVFLAHGKFVVLSAHRIVHVGDTVHRSARHSGLKTQALRCSDALSDALAATVAKTKAAAQQFPPRPPSGIMRRPMYAGRGLFSPRPLGLLFRCARPGVRSTALIVRAAWTPQWHPL
uniref:Uncharacterized protein n=1 Tax=Heliothis virescens TaxID=7102 RepID=A0A2A4JGZ2_HELVI